MLDVELPERAPAGSEVEGGGAFLRASVMIWFFGETFPDLTMKRFGIDVGGVFAGPVLLKGGP